MPYLDHAATTPLAPEALEAMRAAWERPRNASSAHRAGQAARRLLEDARARLAAALDAEPSWVVFTSGASEANNLAIRGHADHEAGHGRRAAIASSPLEHSCVRETVARLAIQGRAAVHTLAVSPEGRADTAAPGLERASLLCLMAVQNETGAVQDLAGARALAARLGARWLCDGAQALGKVPFSVRASGADFVSVSAHKVGGPSGIGALVGPGVTALAPQITGGPQEGGLRAGTQAVALAAGFAAAAEAAVARLAERAARMAELERIVADALDARGVPWRRNGGEPRAPGFFNISIEGLEGADLVIALDARGFEAGSGSACSTGVMEVSPAMHAMFPRDTARAAGALRITFGAGNTPEDAHALGAALAGLAGR
ncbi:MAG: aminotransferase class V-fold PLP-dependent enzyme [Candidatus Sumerlaeia bacterium]|nr:aminotransferase class V-fold PLP-dependent enzyme [Candidatus Sumerlaeia bacterium]